MKVLLSINPEHVNKLFSGEKGFEFRKAIFKREGIDTVVIYSTLPVGKVVGEFSIEEVISAKPKRLWESTSANAGISRSFFDDYFKGKNKGYAIKVGTLTKYPEPKELSSVLPRGIAPQSFCYL